MEFKELTKVVMNPVRQRVIQFLLLHEKGTPGDIQKALSDVPPASLYRHIKILFNAGCIKVVEEKKVRGTVERTYAVEKNILKEEPTNQELASLFYNSLLSLQSTFLHYFEQENTTKSAQEDMILLQTSTLLLSDEEYMELLKKIGSCISEVAELKPQEGRKQRRLTFISSPPEEV